MGSITEPTLAVVAQGAKRTALNGRTFAYSAGQFVITSIELPVVGHITEASAREPFLAFVHIAEPGNVAGIGFAVGYESPSQFSREYRRMFGVPPSRDALALREAAVLRST